jgi:prolyl oligopeptidase PreP (S9A serine peptidase family)
MSPYLHVRDQTRYPAVLLTGGINDHRVPVWQPAKMAARRTCQQVIGSIYAPVVIGRTDTSRAICNRRGLFAGGGPENEGTPAFVV